MENLFDAYTLSNIQSVKIHFALKKQWIIWTFVSFRNSAKKKTACSPLWSLVWFFPVRKTENHPGKNCCYCLPQQTSNCSSENYGPDLQFSSRTMVPASASIAERWSVIADRLPVTISLLLYAACTELTDFEPIRFNLSRCDPIRRFLIAGHWTAAEKSRIRSDRIGLDWEKRATQM